MDLSPGLTLPRCSRLAHFTSCVTLKTLFINLNSQQLNSLAGVTNTETVESSRAPMLSAGLCLGLIPHRELFQFNTVCRTLRLNGANKANLEKQTNK